MLSIYLTRHGQDGDNLNGILNGHRNHGLTDKGKLQAEDIARYIKQQEINLNKIYTSPLKRAYQTAEIIATDLALAEPEKLDLLIERDFGVMTGQKKSEIEKFHNGELLKTNPVTYFLDPTSGETFPAVLARAKSALAQIKEKHNEGSVLLVTHGDTGKMFYASFYNLPWQKVLKSFHFGNGDLLLLSHKVKPEASHILTQTIK